MSEPRDVRHPWHPLFVHFPIACWVLAALLDTLLRTTGLPAVPGIDAGALSHLLLWIGSLGAIPAVVAGLIDYSRLPAAVQDGRSVNRHILWMGAAWVVFLLAGVLRLRSGRFAALAELPVVLAQLGGVVCLFFGGRSAARVVFEELVSAAGEPVSAAPLAKGETP